MRLDIMEYSTPFIVTLASHQNIRCAHMLDPKLEKKMAERSRDYGLSQVLVYSWLWRNTGNTSCTNAQAYFNGLSLLRAVAQLT